MSDYEMRRMRRDELDIAVEWAAAEGWNPGLHDAGTFFAADAEGFFVGLLDGEQIASISVVRYDPAYAFLGFYIVREAFRGAGYGLRIWNHALEQAEATTIGLDGVVAQIGAYERSGFVLAFHNTRFVTVAESRGPDLQSETEIVGLHEVDPAELGEYDVGVFGCARSAFLGAWVRQEGSVVRVARVGSEIVGYGVVRPARDGYRIGPLFADSGEQAEALFDSLAAAVPHGSRVSIDVPGPNGAALTFAASRSMRAEFETARMYRGRPPMLDVARMYGVTTFELG